MGFFDKLSKIIDDKDRIGGEDMSRRNKHLRNAYSAIIDVFAKAQPLEVQAGIPIDDRYFTPDNLLLQKTKAAKEACHQAASIITTQENAQDEGVDNLVSDIRHVSARFSATCNLSSAARLGKAIETQVKPALERLEKMPDNNSFSMFEINQLMKKYDEHFLQATKNVEPPKKGKML